MSDLMLHAIITMPYDMAMSSEMSRRQFYNRVQSLLADREELWNRIESAPTGYVMEGCNESLNVEVDMHDGCEAGNELEGHTVAMVVIR